MNTTNVTQAHVHYAHPLLTWGPVLMGSAVAVVTSSMLNMLGAALGFGVAAIGQTNEAATSGGIVSAVWLVAANLVALAFGAWIAARSSQNPDHHNGTLQGIAVWAVTSMLVLFLAGSAITGIVKTAAQTAGLASGAAIADSNTTGNLQADAEQAANDAQVTITNNRQDIVDTAVTTAAVSAAATFGAFIAMLLGLVAAIVGARAGARHPVWSNRPLYTTTGGTPAPDFRRAA